MINGSTQFKFFDPSTSKLHILVIISSSESFLSLMKQIKAAGYKLSVAFTPDDAGTAIMNHVIDACLIDYDASDEFVSSFLKTLKSTSQNPDITSVVLSDTPSNFDYIMKMGATHFFSKGEREKESVYHIMGIFKILERLKHTEKALSLSEEMVENAALIKADFLNNMSHEIRTPMNGVIGFVDILKETHLNDVQKSYVENIEKSSNILMTLINDLLDYSKIEAGQMAFESVNFDLELMAYDVCELIVPDVEIRPIELLCHVCDTLPPYIIGDPGRFRQILTNLLNNAPKFTDVGEIELNIDVEEETESELKLHITVRDTGIGIKKENLQSIFEPFQQADTSKTRKYGGTGLGLSLCRKMARLMKGDVWAESPSPHILVNRTLHKKWGPGTLFHFTAWVQKESEAHDVKPMHTSLKGKHAFLVDSNETSCMFIESICKEVGIGVVTFQKIAEVQNIFSTSNKEQYLFDFGVIDLNMEGISGLKVAEYIRDFETSQKSNLNPNPKRRLPLIALSVSRRGDALKYKESGFDGILPKPLNRSKFIGMITHVISEQSAKEKSGKDTVPDKVATRHTIKEEMKHSLRILLVEDNPVNRKLAKTMLSKAGYQVTTTNNGQEGVDTFFASPESFDLILMDIQMPIMDGLTATKTIRAKGFNKIPIIAVTANAMNVDKEMCFEAGMSDYLPKPIKRDKIFAKIEKWILKEEDRA